MNVAIPVSAEVVTRTLPPSTEIASTPLPDSVPRVSVQPEHRSLAFTEIGWLARLVPRVNASSTATGFTFTVTVAVAVRPKSLMTRYTKLSTPAKSARGVYCKLPSARNDTEPLAGSLNTSALHEVVQSVAPEVRLSLASTSTVTATPAEVVTSSLTAIGGSATVNDTVAEDVAPLPSVIS